MNTFDIERQFRCPVCLDFPETTKISIICSHRLCTACVSKIFLRDRMCPLCREKHLTHRQFMRDQQYDMLLKIARPIILNENQINGAHEIVQQQSAKIFLLILKPIKNVVNIGDEFQINVSDTKNVTGN